MAKDPRKNVSQFKSSAGGLNEFEFHQHQQELAEQHNVGESHLIPGTPPEDRVQEITRKAHELVMKRAAAKSGSKGAAKKTTKKTAASKKKPAAKKSAAGKKKPATKKSAATKKKPATKSTKK